MRYWGRWGPIGARGRGQPPQPHLNVVQLRPVSCHDIVGASFFQGVAHNHSLGCLPWGLLTVGTEEERSEAGFGEGREGHRVLFPKKGIS